MATEKATALVLRTTDWSETSRIATLWTREFGKVRVLAKGGRRLRSSFENALDLLTLCRIVLIRKTSGGLDLLTEAQVIKRFSRLARSLPALYGGYYVAELLNEGTQENDPHPVLFDDAVAALQELGAAAEEKTPLTLEVMRFEMRLLDELGFRPVLDRCASCGGPVTESGRTIFSVEAGGAVCGRCQLAHRDRMVLSPAAFEALRRLAEAGESWRDLQGKGSEIELRHVLGRYVSYRLGRRPRMLSYLEGLTREPEKGSK